MQALISKKCCSWYDNHLNKFSFQLFSLNDKPSYEIKKCIMLESEKFVVTIKRNEYVAISGT